MNNEFRPRLPLVSFLKAAAAADLFSLVLNVIGSSVPVLLLLLFVKVAATVDIDALSNFLSVISDQSGLTTTFAFFILTVYCTGFGAQLPFLGKFLSKEVPQGTPAYSTFFLRFAKGSNKLHKLLRVSILVLVSYVVLLSVFGMISIPFGHSQQPTVELASHAHGSAFFLLLFIAVVLAPLCEELVYRGFVYQALRVFFRRHAAGNAADMLAMSASALMFAQMHLQTRLALFSFYSRSVALLQSHIEEPEH